MQRTQAPEIQIPFGPGEVQNRKRQLKGDHDADQETHDAPEGRGNRGGPDRAIHVFIGRRGHARLPGAAKLPQEQRAGRCHDQQGMDQIRRVPCVLGRDGGADRNEAEDQKLYVIKH